MTRCPEECRKQWRLKQGKAGWQKQKEEETKEEAEKRQEEKVERKQKKQKKAKKLVSEKFHKWIKVFGKKQSEWMPMRKI